MGQWPGGTFHPLTGGFGTHRTSSPAPLPSSDSSSVLSLNKDQSLLISGMCSLPMARYYIIKDADQRALYTRDGQLLVGDPDADNRCAEKICILLNRGLDRAKVPIFLSIHGGSRCLACVETEEGPSLKLERSVGSAFRLETAAWPGWFLCGPDEPQQPIRLAKETEASVRTEFYFQQSP
ncbi:interleukin-1 family member 10 isoform X2 [Saccopteryx leptura]|uniref:interleukin-1 family member 10 isoform X2 n=1 Tax=Saccopteryx leptura TaxID=249018 RepID=UPI00339BE1A2